MNKYDIYRAKIYLQEEIYKTMIEEIDNITSKQIEDHFCLTEYGIKTPWYKLLSLDKGIKRYFNLLLPSLYRGIEDILPEELGDWCPQRTYPMRYKDKRIILDRINGIVELTEEESIIYKYSSGKLSLNEIIEILTKKLEKSEEELKEKMLNFYKKMNKIYAIIFLRL